VAPDTLYENWLKRISALAFLLPLVLVFLAGDNAYLRIHDTLEGELGWFSLLKQQENPWKINGYTPILGSVDGLQAGALPSPYSLIYLIFHAFELPLAYQVLRFLVQILAFAGMHWLLTKLPGPSGWRFPLAVMFSLLPFYPTFGMSVAGLPGVAAAGLTLRSNAKSTFAWSWLVLFGFFSAPVWGWPPAVVLLLGTACFTPNGRLSFSAWPLPAILLISGMYLVVHFPLWQLLLFNSGTEMHRTAYLPPLFSLKEWIEEGLYMLIVGHYHAGMFYALPAWGMVWVTRKHSKSIRVLTVVLVLVVLVHSIFPYLGHLLPVLVPLRSIRLISLIPLLWILIWFLISARLSAKLFGKLLALQLFAGVLTHDENWHNLRQIVQQPRFPSYREYTGEKLFAEFKSGKDTAELRVACIGFPPSLAWFQGIETIDGLHAIYPLEYKLRFREFIASELEKSSELSTYFDSWGNRCFTFLAELGHGHTANVPALQKERRINSISLDTGAFKRLGGTHLLSGLPLNPGDAWEKSNEISHPEYAWSLHVYRPKDRSAELRIQTPEP